MKILVIGSGGREHALCHKLHENPEHEIYCAPGNGGTALVAVNVPIAVENIEELKNFALENAIDLTIVGPEVPLVMGIADEFEKHNLKIFGPDKKSAQLEGSKAFTKALLEKYGIPTAAYAQYDNYEEALKGLEKFDYPVVIKADGLCAGKGVIIAESYEEGEAALKSILVDKEFGDEGKEVVIEEFLRGYETSVFVVASRGKLFELASAKDHKQIGEGDTGPNTGGVGAFSPNVLMTEETTETIRKEIIPGIERALQEEGLKFNGILFIGFMVTEQGPKVLEFNVRFGDPETQVILQRVKGDLANILMKALEGTLEEKDIQLSEDFALTVILCSGGYPGRYEKGKVIRGLEDLPKELLLLHNGTRCIDGEFVTDGGRVLSLVSVRDSLESGIEEIYTNINKISFDNMYYRRDIAKSACISKAKLL